MSHLSNRRSSWHATILGPLAVLAALSVAHAQGDVERASVHSSGAQADARSALPALNGDGRYVVFSSTATNLVALSTNGVRQIFLRDRATSTTTLITQHLGVAGNADSDAPVISGDGRYIAFHSDASNLGPADVNGYVDVYLYDRQSDAFTLVSNGAFGGGGASGGSCCPGLSVDGRWVAFYSGAADVVLNDTNGWADAFVFDRLNVLTPVQRVSVGPGGVEGNFGSGFAGPGPTSGQIAVASNPNGTDCYVAFQSLASNLVAGAIQGCLTIYMRDTQLGTTSLVSASTSGAQNATDATGVAMSADARYVAFNCGANMLVPGDTNGGGDTFVRDMQTPTTFRVSLSSQQIPAAGGPFKSPFPHHPSISADGRYVAFETSRANLVANDTDGKNSIFVRDTITNLTWRVTLASTGAQPSDHCVAPWISGDGTVVAFGSAAANLVPADTNAVMDVFLESHHPTTVGYCYGDGTGTACPCGNNGGAEKGCNNSAGTGGALLIGLGTTRVAHDTFLLAASTMTPNTFVLFYQGTTAASVPFGDGIRCATTIRRLGVRSVDSSGSRSFGFGIAGDPSISVQGLVPPTGGTRQYQAWYRNAASFCTPSAFNLSNGLRAVWTP
jgi:Tol biopolymer transport system component